MGRKRVIDTDELYFNVKLVKLLNVRGLHLYIRLWGLAEDWGGYEPDYERIALRMGALKFTTNEAEKIITKLINDGKIIPYEVGPRTYHWLKNLLREQPLSNPAPPKLPLPKWIRCEIKAYKSGKKYAQYEVITEKLPVVSTELPVAYQYPTGSAKTKRNEIEKKQKGKGVEGTLPPLTAEDLKKNISDPNILTVALCFLKLEYTFTKNNIVDFVKYVVELERDHPSKDIPLNAKRWRDKNFEAGKMIGNQCKNSLHNWVKQTFADKKGTVTRPKTVKELEEEKAKTEARQHGATARS